MEHSNNGLKEQEDILKLQNLLRKKPTIKVPEFKDDLYFNKDIEPNFIIESSEKNYKLFIRIAALLLLCIVIPFIYRQNHNIQFYKDHRSIHNIGEEANSKKDIIGYILLVKGDAYIIDKNNQRFIANSGITIMSDSTVITNKNSSIDLLLQHKVYLKISENTKIVLKLNEKKFHAFQEYGESYHNIKKLEPKEEYIVETPTTIAGVRGTFFKVRNQDYFQEIQVSKGKIVVFLKEKSQQNIVQIKQLDVLTKNDYFYFDQKNKKMEKKYAKNLELDVIYNQMIKNLKEIDEKELWEEIKKIPNTNNKKDIEKVYNKRVEIIKLKDGRILEGVIASQLNNQVILHTTKGIFVININEIKEILYQNE